MEPWQVTLVVALIGAVTGSLSFFKGLRRDRVEAKKAEAEAAGSLVLSSTELVDRLEVRLDKMEDNMKEQDRIIASQNEQIVVLTAKVSVLESERSIMLEGIESLCDQIRQSDQKPVWTPEVDDEGRIVG